MNSPNKVIIDLTNQEVNFLSWCMKFIQGGPFGIEEEIQRSNFETKLIQIIKDLEEGYIYKYNNGEFTFECAFCNGGGIFPNIFSSDEIETMVCPVCNGIGFSKIKIAHENLIKCRFCGGDGKEWDSDGYYTGEVCPVCKGFGYVSLENLSESSTENVFWALVHPKIKKVSQSRFESSHYSDAVEAAFKEINCEIKRIVKLNSGKEIDGVPLMREAFSPNQPIIQLADLSTETGKNIQNGYMQIFAGAMMGVRNPKAHKNEEIDRLIAILQINLASHLMLMLEKRL
ncbi:MAG: TIGR02391 family protein [Chloroflexi bacterium]|nr:TIGR02391 family protein [Chloroflexota bacterium]